MGVSVGLARSYETCVGVSSQSKWGLTCELVLQKELDEIKVVVS